MATLRQYSPAERRWRLGLTAVLAVYGWVLLRSPGSYTWLDSLDRPSMVYLAGALVYCVAIVAGWMLADASAPAPAKRPMRQRTGAPER
jgi:hypothetical protein